MPVALPVTADPGLLAPNGKPGGPAQRPLAGPVVLLNATSAEGEELLGETQTWTRDTGHPDCSKE